jgi:hypothetical protein
MISLSISTWQQVVKWNRVFVSGNKPPQGTMGTEFGTQPVRNLRGRRLDAGRGVMRCDVRAMRAQSIFVNGIDARDQRTYVVQGS